MGDLFKKMGQPQETLLLWRLAIAHSRAIGIPTDDNEQELAAFERELQAITPRRSWV